MILARMRSRMAFRCCCVAWRLGPGRRAHAPAGPAKRKDFPTCGCLMKVSDVLVTHIAVHGKADLFPMVRWADIAALWFSLEGVLLRVVF